MQLADQLTDSVEAIGVERRKVRGHLAGYVLQHVAAQSIAPKAPGRSGEAFDFEVVEQRGYGRGPRPGRLAHCVANPADRVGYVPAVKDLLVHLPILTVRPRSALRRSAA